MDTHPVHFICEHNTYRFDKVRERAKLKQAVFLLATFLFPVLEKSVSSLHMTSAYKLLCEFPGAH